MGMSSLSGRARTSITEPDSFAVCDFCGLWQNHSKMNWQMEWTGDKITNLRLLVCEDCADRPNEQLRNLVLPPDPIPTRDPRLEPFQYDATAGNIAGQGTNVPSGTNSYYNWDTPGATWDSQGQMWDNVDQDVPAEVPD